MKSLILLPMGRIIINLAKGIGTIFSFYRLNLVGRALSRLCFNFYRSFENHNYKKTSNGEFLFLKRLKNLDNEVQIIFDVGANKGEWAQDTALYFPEAKIYCFEPIETTFSILKKEVTGKSNIQCFNFGLSNQSETLTFYISNNSDELSSSIKIVAEQTTKKLHAKVKKGMEFCEEQGIEQIDFLKIDVEGMENKVLEGLAPLLEQRKIKFIQFEYGLVNIESKFLLKDFYELFSQYGYHLGKLYPTGILFKDYEYTDENFIGPNYIAVLDTYKNKFTSF